MSDIPYRRNRAGQGFPPESLDNYNKDFDLQFYMSAQEEENTSFDVRLFYIMSGTMSVIWGTDRFAVKRDDFFIVNAGQNYHWKSGDSCIYACLNIRYRLFVERMGTPYVYFQCNSAQKSADDNVYGKLAGILGELIREYILDTQAVGFKRDYLWYKLMDNLVHNFSAHTPQTFERLEIDQRISYAVQYICANYPEPLPIKKAADEMHMSASAFSRWFKKRSGLNYGDFILEVRMAHAVDDLKHSSKVVTDIAMDNGFSSISVFTKLFHKKYGVTPTAWRKTIQEGAEASGQKVLTVGQLQKLEAFKRLQERDVKGETAINIRCHTNEGAPWENLWNKAVNAGEAYELLSARMQKQLKDLQEKLGFKYVRISNIFSDKLKLRQSHSIRRLNYDCLDTVMDFILSCGMHPFIDLCDRAYSVLIAMSESLYQENTESIFATEDELYSVVTDVFKHFIWRYGAAEVSQWLLECWYDDRKYQVFGLDADYAKVFKRLSLRLKEIVPGIRLGGCGLDLSVSPNIFQTILREMSVLGIAPDFVTMYIYPYNSGYSCLSDFEYTAQALRQCQDILNQEGFGNTEIYVTEWNLSVSGRNYYNDSCAKAAMMLRHITSTVGTGQMYIYSLASDLATNYYDSSRLLYGSPGLCSRDGLYKPVCHALLFWGQLAGRLICSGDNHIVTAGDRGEYDVLLFHPKSLNYKYFLKKEYDIRPESLKEYFEDDLDLDIRIELEGVDGYCYFLKKHILNNNNGSLLDAWLDMHLVDTASAKDIEYLRNIVRPRIIFQKSMANSGILFIRERLSPHEIIYIHIYPQ